MLRKAPAPVLVVGRLPPPVDGMGAVTAHVLGRLGENAEVADLSAGALSGGPLAHPIKALRVAMALARVARGIFRAGRGFYMPADGGFGALYTIALVAAARATGHHVFLHHHSYAYLGRRRRLMAALVAAGGSRCRHILLCPIMARRFQALYPGACSTMVLSNAVFTPPRAFEVPGIGDGGPLRLGHLSNLCPEKGLDTLFDLMRALAADGVAATLTLAGPGATPRDGALIQAGLAEFGPRIRHLGPVGGAAKTAFLQDIDVFVFPTRYRHEAEPLVVWEALAMGVPVLAHGRGCLAAMPGTVPVDANFVAAARPLLAQWAADRAALRAAARQAHARATAAHAAATRDLDALVAAIAGGDHSLPAFSSR